MLSLHQEVPWIIDDGFRDELLVKEEKCKFCDSVFNSAIKKPLHIWHFAKHGVKSLNIVLTKNLPSLKTKLFWSTNLKSFFGQIVFPLIYFCCQILIKFSPIFFEETAKVKSDSHGIVWLLFFSTFQNILESRAKKVLFLFLIQIFDIKILTWPSWKPLKNLKNFITKIY